MNVILSRHGNTFGPGDPVVWAGSRNDLPLVEKGFAQAIACARALKLMGKPLQAIYCGPLLRTRDYAETILKELGLPLKPIVDTRLTELDYGDWTGLTQAEVLSQFGENAVKGWEERSEWPQPSQGAWGGSEASVRADVESFARELTQRHQDDDLVLVVSSNGRLRYFLTLVEGEFSQRIAARDFKMKTGSVGKLVYGEGRWQLRYWNREPQQGL